MRFPFCRWQTWCSRINTTQTGAKQPESSGKKATTGLSSSGKSSSYTEINRLTDHVCLYLQVHMLRLTINVSFYELIKSITYSYKALQTLVCVWVRACMCGLCSPLQGYTQSIAVLIFPHSVSAPLIRRTGWKSMDTARSRGKPWPCLLLLAPQAVTLK